MPFAGLTERSISVLRCASVYSTEPRDVLDQPWFLNSVLQAETSLSPDELLSACLEIEQEHGRRRDQFKGPRTLDMDILIYGNTIVQQPGLTVPHPGLAARRFVLVPLAEIAPDFVEPCTGKPIRQLLEECPTPLQ